MKNSRVLDAFTWTNSIINIIEMFIIGFAIYGIDQNQSTYMIPYLTLSVARIFILVVEFLLLIFLAANNKGCLEILKYHQHIFPNSGKNYAYKDKESLMEILVSKVFTMLVGCFLLVFLAQKYYCTAVVYSHYRNISAKKEKKIKVSPV